MSPRRITQDCEIEGSPFLPRRGLFLCLALATATLPLLPNPTSLIWVRTDPRQFLLVLDHIFCAGAWAARCLIVQVPLPMLFNRYPDLALSDDAAFGGWAFRGPLTLPVRWAV